MCNECKTDKVSEVEYEEIRVSIDKSKGFIIKDNDEIEVVIRGKAFEVKSYAMGLMEMKLKAYPGHVGNHCVIVNNATVKSITKITKKPKATPLQVGECYKYPNHQGVWQVLEIDNKCREITVWVKHQYNTIVQHTISNDSLYYRESGVPIDWDATFQ